jgi:CysZ protein
MIILNSILLGLADLKQKELRRILIKSLILSAMSFFLIFAVCFYLLTHTHVFSWHWLEITMDTIGTLVIIVMSLLLFPASVSAISTLFLDDIVTVLEKKHAYTKLPVYRRSLIESGKANLRFVLIFVGVNLILIPLYLIPWINLVAFLSANAYLISREYFELIAAHHLPQGQARELRLKYSKTLLTCGFALAGFSLIPGVNLLFPIIVTAVMTHLFNGIYNHKMKSDVIPL